MNRLAWIAAFAAALVLACGHALVALGAGAVFGAIPDRETAGTAAGALLTAWSPLATGAAAVLAIALGWLGAVAVGWRRGLLVAALALVLAARWMTSAALADARDLRGRARAETDPVRAEQLHQAFRTQAHPRSTRTHAAELLLALTLAAAAGVALARGTRSRDGLAAGPSVRP